MLASITKDASDKKRIRTLDELPCQGRRVLVRIDANVPLSEGRVADDTRIKAALPTIRKLQAEGASVVLMSHLGRPKGQFTQACSLRPVRAVLEAHLGRIAFAAHCIGEAVEAQARALGPGEVMLLENLRFSSGETACDPTFSQQLAALGDVYVNDAFGTAHRKHASTVGVASFFQDKGAGYLLQKEVESVHRVLSQHESPFLAIMGGAKVSDKIPLIEHLLPLVDKLLIGGGMAYTFTAAMGGHVGASLLEQDQLSTARRLLNLAREGATDIVLPVDAVCADAFAADAKTCLCPQTAIKEAWQGLDIGPKTQALFAAQILKSQTIVWNGPMGVFEFEAFASGTQALAEAVAGATRQGAFSLVGGGDSIAALKQAHLADQISHVSTGGGALLTLLEGKTLAALEALEAP